MLGRLAEVVTGQSLDELLRERVFDPLGMVVSLETPIHPGVIMDIAATTENQNPISRAGQV